MTIDRFLLIVVVFAASVITAGYFLSGHIGLVAPSAEPSISKTIPAPPPAAQGVPEAPLVRRPVRVIPIERPESETTGMSPTELEAHADRQSRAAPKQPRCNRRACSGAYRSFDASTCTYQPGGGRPRRLCEK